MKDGVKHCTAHSLTVLGGKMLVNSFVKNVVLTRITWAI